MTESIFRETGLDVFLDKLKRIQGNSVSFETIALVSTSVEMTGLSVNRLDRILSDDMIREEYGLGTLAPRPYTAPLNVWVKTVMQSCLIWTVFKRKIWREMDRIFMDRTSMYFEAPQKGIVRVGYSRDYRPDRPQVTVGLSIDGDSGVPAGLTISSGNILNVTHFKDTFNQILPPLSKDSMFVFDNGAYSLDNAKLPDSKDMGFVTRQ